MQRMKEGSVDISMLIKLFSWSRKSEHWVLKLAILAAVFDFTTTLFLSLLWPGEAGPPPPWSDWGGPCWPCTWGCKSLTYWAGRPRCRWWGLCSCWAIQSRCGRQSLHRGPQQSERSCLGNECFRWNIATYHLSLIGPLRSWDPFQDAVPSAWPQRSQEVIRSTSIFSFLNILVLFHSNLAQTQLRSNIHAYHLKPRMSICISSTFGEKLILYSVMECNCLYMISCVRALCILCNLLSISIISFALHLSFPPNRDHRLCDKTSKDKDI